MDIGIIGLGRMGANMAERLVRGSHRVSGYDPSPQARAQAQAKGVAAVDSIAALVAKLAAPRAVWMMVPAGAPVDATLTELTALFAAGDAIIDGGNSNYKDSQRRAQQVGVSGLHYIDAGTSGGIWGLAEGYSLMLGGDAAVIERLRPIFETLAPAPDRGWGRVGPSGAGHYTKMVHNGIEYGLMQAYGEGFALLSRKPGFDLDVHQIAEIWRYGSVVRSWLLDLAAQALLADPALASVAPYVDDSGEGRWTVAEAIDLDIAAPVITAALLERLRSRDTQSYSDRLLAALRHEFGGHAIKADREP
jgi:6-phosphogluconate dehydrogenase